MDSDDLRDLDRLVQRGAGVSRSEPPEHTIPGEPLRPRRVAFIEECAKLDPEVERAEAEQWLSSEVAPLEY